MEPLLTGDQIRKAGYFIYKNGRLLEKKIFAYFFENGSLEGCLKALAAYQNEDGGFGNGIELDLLCPDSTPIGAETALVILDQLGCPANELSPRLFEWIASNQRPGGFLDHPPANLAVYPHQPWWANPDQERILSLAAILKKWGVDRPEIFAGAERFFRSAPVPEEFLFYHYPYYLYLKYCSHSEDERALFSKIVKQLPHLFAKERSHHPLFSRYWYLASDDVAEAARHAEAKIFVSAIHDDGDIDTPYPDLPWWRPVFLLDGLIQLQKLGYL
jgi:hypothetical protein